MKPKFYVSAALRFFQGFNVRDIKEWSSEQRVEVHWAQEADWFFSFSANVRIAKPHTYEKSAHLIRKVGNFFHKNFKIN